jgi:hypothetical protein
MQKLIKLSESHYIVVDDSEIKIGEYCFDLKEKEFYKSKGNIPSNPYVLKITHSTQPLEDGIGKPINGTYPPEYLRFDKIKQLSLSSVEELTLGYSVEEMSINSFGHKPSKDDTDIILSLGKGYIGGYQQGFNTHKELVKDKLFTVEDMKNAFNAGYDLNTWEQLNIPNDEREYLNEYDYIQSLLPKTEWDVTFDEQGKLKLI